MWRRKLYYRQSNFLSFVDATTNSTALPDQDKKIKCYIQGDSDEQRLIFLIGFFLFPSGFTMVANAFTITFSADVFGDVILTSEGVLAIQCIYSTRQKTDNSFFIRFGSNGKLMI